MRTCAARDGQCAQLARHDERRGRVLVGKHHLDAPGDDVVERKTVQFLRTIAEPGREALVGEAEPAINVDGIEPCGQEIQEVGQILAFLTENIIDGAVSGVGSAAVGSGQLLRKLQTGFVRSYAALMLVGIALLLLAIWVVTQ